MLRTRNRRWEEMDKSSVDLSVLIQHYEVHNRSEGKSSRTVEWYNQVLKMFSDWLKREGLPTHLGPITDMEVRRFILHLQEKPGTKGDRMSTHSIANRTRALRAFFAWLARRGYTEEHILKDLCAPKTM